MRFEKGQRKDDVAQEHLAGYEQTDGIYMVGVAQEKISTFRTEMRRNPHRGPLSVDRACEHAGQPVARIWAGR